MKNTKAIQNAAMRRAQAFSGLSSMALVLALATVPTVAFAQDDSAKPQSTEADAKDKEIVVTGTLIRGIAPGGSQLIGVDQEKIASTGAVNTSDLIATIPQTETFGRFVGIRGTNNFSLMVNRPSLRNLGITSGSTNNTLVLLDGHRLPGMGIFQSSPDLDAIAASAIERVDVVTDGGSSTYGSDAVGGVMNFVTRKKFDGVQVKASYGFADDFSQYNASIIAGGTIGDVSAYIAYDYATHDDIKGGDRDWSRNLDWINGVGASTACPVANVRASGVTYALPGLTPGLGNRCDSTDLSSIYPREIKHSVLGSIVVDPGGPVSFAVKAYYVNRKDYSDGGPRSVPSGVAVPSSSPFFIPLPGAPTSETFIFDLSPVFGNHTRQNATMESWGVTPSMRFDAGGGWQLNALVNYGIANAQFIGDVVNTAPIATAAAAGTFNPANLTAATNAAALATATDWIQFGRARQEMINVRAVADGPLFELPGGAVRAAVGVEYLYEKYAGNNSRGLTAAALAALTNRVASRNVKSVFGELNVPILGEGSGVHSLSVTASGRYDDYSDFGGTFNPKIGVNFAPVEWLKLRGNWGKAFQAPGISDLALGGAPALNILPLATLPFSNPALPINGRGNLITMGGTKLPLDSQKAKTWSVGFDMNPPIIEGLSMGMTYYSIDFKGAIAIPPIFNPSQFYPDFPNNYVTYDKGEAAMQAYFNQLAAEGATNAPTILASLPGGNFSTVYGVLDARTTNLARAMTTGLDFYTRLRHDTGFGNVYAEVSGNYILSFKSQTNPAAIIRSTVEADTTRLKLTSTLGANVGNLQGQITWNYSQGYKITPTAANLQQNRVASYNLFNLYFQYSVPGDSAIAKDLVFSLNVDNLFDQDPPLFRGATGSFFGIANGFTLGRLVRFGVSKKF